MPGGDGTYMTDTGGGTAPGGINTSSYTVNSPIGNPMGEQQDEVQTTTIITPGSNNNDNVTSFTPNPVESCVPKRHQFLPAQVFTVRMALP